MAKDNKKSRLTYSKQPCPDRLRDKCYMMRAYCRRCKRREECE